MCSNKADCFRMKVDLITFAVEIFPQNFKDFFCHCCFRSIYVSTYICKQTIESASHTKTFSGSHCHHGCRFFYGSLIELFAVSKQFPMWFLSKSKIAQMLWLTDMFCLMEVNCSASSYLCVLSIFFFRMVIIQFIILFG